MTNISFYISPHFIVKHYLLRDIKNVSKKYSFTGSVLDVGCGEKPYKYLFTNVKSYIGIDLKNYSQNASFKREKPDVYFSSEYAKTLQLPFPDKKFDHSFAFQVAEHHPDPSILFSEMTRVTKRGGYILVSLPFIWGLHEEPRDYFRFTKYSLHKIFQKNNCKIIKTAKQGAISSTIIILLIDYLIELSAKNRVVYIMCVLLFPLLLFLSYCCLLLDKIFKSERIFLNYLILAKKYD